MQAGEIGGSDHPGIVDQLSNDELWFGMKAAGGKVFEVGRTDGAEQQLPRDRDTPAEHE
jgi:hypothetical protein